jgi:HEPN domain-containing protein
MNRSKDWLSQAERDLEQAEWNLKGKFYQWSCFSAQQAAEKAVKGLCEELNVEGWGHAINKLFTRLQKVITVPAGLIEKA